jgi:hypothetical protein
VALAGEGQRTEERHLEGIRPGVLFLKPFGGPERTDGVGAGRSLPYFVNGLDAAHGMPPPYVRGICPHHNRSRAENQSGGTSRRIFPSARSFGLQSAAGYCKMYAEPDKSKGTTTPEERGRSWKENFAAQTAM